MVELNPSTAGVETNAHINSSEKTSALDVLCGPERHPFFRTLQPSTPPGLARTFGANVEDTHREPASGGDSGELARLLTSKPDINQMNKPSGIPRGLSALVSDSDVLARLAEIDPNIDQW